MQLALGERARISEGCEVELNYCDFLQEGVRLLRGVRVEEGCKGRVMVLGALQAAFRSLVKGMISAHAAHPLIRAGHEVLGGVYYNRYW